MFKFHEFKNKHCKGKAIVILCHAFSKADKRGSKHGEMQQ